MVLRIVTLLVYAFVAAMAVAAIGPSTRLSWRALIQPYAYAPDLTLPWVWLALTLAVAVAIAATARRMLAGRRVGLRRYVAVLVVGAVALSVRRYVVVPSRPTVEDGVAHLVARVEVACDDAYAQKKEYPDDVPTLTARWPAELRELGFYRRGALPLTSRLLVVPNTWGPALRPPPGAHPGDVVLTLSQDRRSYWISAFSLDRLNRLVPLTDERGRAIVASATNGRAASRLDPLFPEYPSRIDSTGVTP